MTALFVGVDGGGSKTEFVGIDADGVERATFRTGSTYPPEVGLDEVVSRLRAGIAAICAQAGTSPRSLAYVFFGLPGHGEDTVVDPQLERACGALLGHDRYACDNDMVCGWAGSLGCADGINIVAGTGSIGYGRRGERSARAGGWGEVFGDEGSAYWIAERGLAAFSRMSDGRLPEGPLYRRIRSTLSLARDIDLCERVLGQAALSRAELAALAPVVSAAAEEGDAAAARILSDAATELVAIALAVRDRLGFAVDTPVDLSWSGSILASVERVRSRFLGLLTADGGVRIVEPRFTPGYGAALYARLLATRMTG